MPGMKKYPWLAAVLNFILPGAGYLYAGTRIRFGILLVAAMILWSFGPTPKYAQDVSIDPHTAANDPGLVVMTIAGVMIAAGFAYDAYIDTKVRNGQTQDKGIKDKQA